METAALQALKRVKAEAHEKLASENVLAGTLYRDDRAQRRI
jgi:hypothetical protein